MRRIQEFGKIGWIRKLEAISDHLAKPLNHAQSGRSHSREQSTDQPDHERRTKPKQGRLPGDEEEWKGTCCVRRYVEYVEQQFAPECAHDSAHECYQNRFRQNHSKYLTVRKSNGLQDSNFGSPFPQSHRHGIARYEHQ